MLLLAVAIFGSSAPAPGQRSTTLTVQDAEWAPYYFGGEGLQKGFAKEVLERCLPAGGLTFEFASFPIVRMFNYLRSGQIDVHVVSHTEEREAFLFYGQEPLFESSYRPIVARSSTVEVAALEDLDGLRLGAIRGVDYIDWYQEYLDRRDAEGSIEWAPDNESVLRMLLADRIDVFVNTVATAKWLAGSFGASDEIRVLDFEIKTSPYFVVVSRASTRVADPRAFLEAVDRCIRDFRSSGEYESLADRYMIR